MFIDLDNFKNINDTLGHHVGDKLLIQVGQRLSSCLRATDTVARMGGDEFILLINDIEAQEVSHVAMKLLATIAEPYEAEPHSLIITTSIGIAIYPHDGEDFGTLYQHADTAMYKAKQAGRHNFCFFSQAMHQQIARTLQLDNALRQALERNELFLHYQPQLSISDGSIIGAEVLLRWKHPDLGNISPAEFIPIAETSGQIIAIGEWVLRTAAQQLKTWMNAGLPPMVIAVNLSAVQFRHPDLPGMVSKILNEIELPPEYLELELTEGVSMEDPIAAIAAMSNLHERGVRMSIDDFGTGYSSLNHLKKFKVYKLKIDQSFVRDIAIDTDDKAIVIAIIQMSRSLGFQTIAEGVETASQLAFLREHGCDEAQGYYFSKPLPADEFKNFCLRLKK